MKHQDHPYQAHQQELEKARLQEKFRLKKFSERNLRKYWASRVLSYLTNLFSVATGFTFLLLFSVQYVPSLLSPTLAYFIAGAFTLVILVSIEYFKRESIYDYYVEGYLKNHQAYYMSILFNVGLVVASVFLSVRGADMFVRVSDQQATHLKQEVAQVQDSVSRHYQALLLPYQDKVKHYSGLSQKRADAHIWGRLTDEENQDLAFAQSQIQKYENLQNIALSETKEKFKQASEVANANTNDQASYMMWLAGINEFVCVLLIFFVHYYEYRKWHEYQNEIHEAKTTGYRFNKGLNGFKNPDFEGDLHSINNSYKDTTVGFKMDSPPTPKGGVSSSPPSGDSGGYSSEAGGLSGELGLSLKNLNDLKAFLKKYAHVVKCVQEGMSNMEVTRACEVSLSTVHNVKRCMRSVQAYTNEEFANI